jgi:DNA repair protein RadA/Sms
VYGDGGGFFLLPEQRWPTGLAELDRVLGGGFVPGSLVLVGGDPGIGKSTLALQAAHRLAEAGRTVLYVAGEESPQQTRMRAERVGALSRGVWVVSETDLDAVLATARKLRPALLVVDSIQTVYRPDVPSAPGSVGQVRECAAALLQLAKSEGVAVLLVGHVTKEGMLAGPKVLEHLVDTVLYFEGERHQAYRILRAVKNRFGSTNEIGVFEMRGSGLVEVPNPSTAFLSDRPPGASGAAVVCTLEGSRPLLVEVQALVSPSAFGTPRRATSGVDYNRLLLLLAVLEKHAGLGFSQADVYANAAGGGAGGRTCRGPGDRPGGGFLLPQHRPGPQDGVLRGAGVGGRGTARAPAGPPPGGSQQAGVRAGLRAEGGAVRGRGRRA